MNFPNPPGHSLRPHCPQTQASTGNPLENRSPPAPLTARGSLDTLSHQCCWRTCCRHTFHTPHCPPLPWRSPPRTLHRSLNPPRQMASTHPRCTRCCCPRQPASSAQDNSDTQSSWQTEVPDIRILHLANSSTVHGCDILHSVVHVSAPYWCEPGAFCRGVANPPDVWISAAFVSAGTVESAETYGPGWPISCSRNVAACSLSSVPMLLSSPNTQGAQSDAGPFAQWRLGLHPPFHSACKLAGAQEQRWPKCSWQSGLRPLFQRVLA